MTYFDVIFLKRVPEEMLHYGRGRPRGQRQSMAEVVNCWYLIGVSEKYGVKAHELLASFQDAWTHGKSVCDSITIQCRQKTVNDGVFLVTQGQKIITQLRLSDTMLRHMPNVNVESFQCDPPTSVQNTQSLEPIQIQIKDMGTQVKRVDLKAKVVEKSATRTVHSSYGDPLHLSIATISDGTGSIKLPLWNAQENMVSVGDTVEIENGRLRRYRGELQVSIGRHGKLKVI